MRLPLQSRYALILVGLTLVVGAVLSGLSLYHLRTSSQELTEMRSEMIAEQLLSQVSKRAAALSAHLARNLANPLYLSNMSEMQDLLAAAQEEPDVVLALVYDADARIVHDGTDALARLHQPLDAPWAVRALKGGHAPDVVLGQDLCEAAHPIRVGDEVLGGVMVALSLDAIRGDLRSMRKDLRSTARAAGNRSALALAFSMAVFVGGAALLSVSVAESMARPIRALARHAARIGQGDYRPPPALKRRDEIGELCDAFRAMSGDLHRTTVSRDYVESILASMTESLALLRPDGTMEKVNDSLCRLVGRTREQLLGQHCVSLLAEEERERLSDLFDGLIEGGRPFSVDSLLLGAEGQHVPVVLSAAPMRESASSEMRVVCVAQDITERVRAEQAVRYRLRLWQLVTAISTDFIRVEDAKLDAAIEEALATIGEFAAVDRSYVVLLSDDGTTLRCSHQWCARGFPARKPPSAQVLLQELPSWSSKLKSDSAIVLTDLSQDTPEAEEARGVLVPEAARSVLALPMRIGGRTVGLLGFDSKHTRESWSDDNVALLRIAGEILAGAIDRRRSRSEQFALEQQMLHAQKLESLGVLAGGIAHDFNNLLMGILGNTEVALEDLPEECACRESLAEVLRAGRRAADLVNQMLTYSGKRQPVVGVMDLNALIGEMVQLLRASIPPRVSLNYDLDDGLPLAPADETQIRQVIMNLITNAAEAIGDRTGTVDVRTRSLRVPDESASATLFGGREVPPGDYIAVEVADDGCGMDEDTKARIFDPFFSTKFTGRGLGLAAALGIVNGHNGTLLLESTPGKGSTFTVLLPRTEGEGEAVSPPGIPPADVPLRGSGRLLLVDDEEAVRNVAVRMLSRLGFDVETASDGNEAIHRFEENPTAFSAVVLDYSMPAMNGRQTYDALRQIRPDVQVVVMSGYGNEESARNFPESECIHFVQKPFHFSELAAALGSAMASG